MNYKIKYKSKYAWIFIAFLFSEAAVAQRYIDILPLQLQFRYEDSASQSKEIVQYQSFDIAAQQDQYRLGFGFSKNETRTGNPSLNITTQVYDYALTGGYLIFEISAPEKKRSLNFFATATLGTTQLKVSTQLLGSSPTSAESNKNMIYGAGVTLVGRAKYFLFETDFKIINSKNYSPQYIPVMGIKMGASIPF